MKTIIEKFWLGQNERLEAFATFLHNNGVEVDRREGFVKTTGTHLVATRELASDCAETPNDHTIIYTLYFENQIWAITEERNGFDDRVMTLANFEAKQYEGCLLRSVDTLPGYRAYRQSTASSGEIIPDAFIKLSNQIKQIQSEYLSISCTMDTDALSIEIQEKGNSDLTAFAYTFEIILAGPGAKELRKDKYPVTKKTVFCIPHQGHNNNYATSGQVLASIINDIKDVIVGMGYFYAIDFPANTNTQHRPPPNKMK